MKQQKHKINIAIDGYSSCGKITLAKALAEKLNYIFIDSGAMYRAITLYMIKKGLVAKDYIDVNKIISSLDEIELHFENNLQNKKPEIILNNENVSNAIRSIEVNAFVSKIATIKEVRKKLVKLQQKIGKRGGVVMDGRDIGSVVFPDAEVKFFITADSLIRAKRRFIELNDNSITIDDVLMNLKERDFIDTTREESPLIQVSDAIVIDNSNLNQEQQLEIAFQITQKKLLTI